MEEELKSGCEAVGIVLSELRDVLGAEGCSL